MLSCNLPGRVFIPSYAQSLYVYVYGRKNENLRKTSGYLKSVFRTVVKYGLSCLIYYLNVTRESTAAKPLLGISYRKFTLRVNFRFISVNFASLKNWLEIVERRNEKTAMKKRNKCQDLTLLEKIETRLEKRNTGNTISSTHLTR